MMHEMSTFQHLWDHIDDVATGAGALFVLSSAARSLPEPEPNTGFWASWGYRFAQMLVANWDKTKAKAE